jgi:hypothetical protein
MVADRMPIAASILLQAAHNIPPVVTDTFQQGFGRGPSIAEGRVRMAAPAMAGIAEALERQRIFRGASFVPEERPERNPEGPIRPDQQDQGTAIDRPVLLTGKDSGQPFDGRRQGFRHDRIIEHESASFPSEPGAQGICEASLSRPIALPHPRQAVMRHGCPHLSQSDTTARCAIIEPCGEIEPNEPWHRVPSFVTVGWALYSISSLPPNPRKLLAGAREVFEGTGIQGQPEGRAGGEKGNALRLGEGRIGAIARGFISCTSAHSAVMRASFSGSDKRSRSGRLSMAVL